MMVGPADQRPAEGAAQQRFGDYALLDKIAEGGMAEVFLAKRRGVEGFEKTVAIKRILPELSLNRDFVSMFINEAKIAARLSHPNIAQIFDFGKIDNYYFIAMEYVPGGNLRTILQRSADSSLRMPRAIAATIIARACAGLEHAHKKTDDAGKPLRIIHRDVSPQNVLVSYEGEVKLVDFGIAKAVAESPEVTRGVLKGKLSYLSPEQILGNTLDARSDVFAIGLVLYELLTGQKLFRAQGTGEILDAIVRVDSAEVTKSIPDLPRALREILRKAIANDPGQRYESAGAMQRALEDYARQESSGEVELRNYMRALFHDKVRVGLTTLTRLRAEILGKNAKPGIPRLSARMSAALGGAIAGLVALALTVPVIDGGETGPANPGAESPAEGPEPKTDESPPVRDVPPPEPETPGTAEAERALAALAAGKAGKAVADFERAFAENADLRDEFAAPFAQALVGDGKEVLEEDTGRAEDRFRQAIEVKPDLFEAHFHLAKVLARRSDPEGAAREYRAALDIDPRSADARYNLGYIRFTQKRYEQALEEFEAAAKLEPPYLDEVYYNIAAAYERMGKKPDAIGALRRGLVAAPQSELLKKRLKQLGG